MWSVYYNIFEIKRKSKLIFPLNNFFINYNIFEIKRKSKLIYLSSLFFQNYNIFEIKRKSKQHRECISKILL